MASTDRVTLYGLMVKPIQRFPQFILLLQVWATPCFAPHFGRHSARDGSAMGLFWGWQPAWGLWKGLWGFSYPTGGFSSIIA